MPYTPEAEWEAKHLIWTGLFSDKGLSMKSERGKIIAGQFGLNTSRYRHKTDIRNACEALATRRTQWRKNHTPWKTSKN